MTDRPSPLRDARPEDAPAIAAIFEACLPDPWSAEMIADSFRHGCHGLVACDPDDAASIVGVSLVQWFAPEAEILLVAVLPSHRRRGIARALLRGSLMQAARAGAEAAFLEVRPSNAGARAFYEEEGFREVGRRRAYYRNGEDALVLRRDLRFPLPLPAAPP